MLQQVLEYIHNYFIKDRHESEYEIADGMISLPFALDGQRILIQGSCLNDGVYTYHGTRLNNDDDTEVAGLSDESFMGVICALAVPPTVIALSEEIKQWVAKYGDIADSPYQSESFGGYSYSKGTSGSENNRNSRTSWEQVFSSRLNRYRRISV